MADKNFKSNNDLIKDEKPVEKSAGFKSYKVKHPTITGDANVGVLVSNSSIQIKMVGGILETTNIHVIESLVKEGWTRL